MTLYEITEEVQALDSLIENSLVDADGNPREPTEEEQAFILSQICETETMFRGKAEGICKFRASLLATAKAFKDEEARLEKRRKTMERKAECLRMYLDISMEKIKSDKLEAGLFRLRFQKNPPSVQIAIPEALDAKYFRIIPETREPDKNLIKKDYEVGAYPWGAIVQGKSLRIE
jgi:hypothetical protein